jgi:polysaccharide pyruvyl transferase WcaK-like protein
MARPRRVLAIGWFGAGNLGDEAMLEGLQRWATRALGPVELTVTSSDPEGTRAGHGVRAIALRPPEDSGFRAFDLVGATWRADVVTLGGGDLIREQADGVAPALNWLTRMRVPFGLRRRTALVGISVGELFSPRVLEAVGHHVRRFGLVAARDTASAARLAELSGRPVEVMGDLALEALAPLPARAERQGPPRIGLTPRHIHGRGPGVPTDATERLGKTLASALDAVVAETGASIELIPFRAGRNKRDDDDVAGEAIAAAAATGAAWRRWPAPVRAADFAAIVTDLDLVLSVRLHGAVLAAAAGRPVLAISYDDKVRGFLKDLELPDQALPLDADANEIRAAVLRSLADDALDARVRTGVTAARARTAALDARLRALASG